MILPQIECQFKNKKKIEQIIHFKENFNGITEFKNCEIINDYEAYLTNEFVRCNLYIRENEFKYPFSNNYIPKEYCEVHTKIHLKNKLNCNKNFIQEKFIIKPHNPGPFNLYIDYSLKVDGERIVRKDYYGDLSSETLNVIFTTNDKVINLAKKMNHYLKKYPTKIE